MQEDQRGLLPILGSLSCHDRVSLALCRDRDLRVATGFPGILGGLGSDKVILLRDKDFWPRVATGCGAGTGCLGLDKGPFVLR